MTAASPVAWEDAKTRPRVPPPPREINQQILCHHPPVPTPCHHPPAPALCRPPNPPCVLPAPPPQATSTSTPTSTSVLPSLGSILGVRVATLHHVPKGARDAWSGIMYEVFKAITIGLGHLVQVFHARTMRTGQPCEGGAWQLA